MNRKKINCGSGKQWVEGKHFRLAREIKYIQRQAATLPRPWRKATGVKSHAGPKRSI